MGRRRGKLEQESGDSGGGWIFAYADMMSLLFCFFVMLHSFNHVDDQKMEDITKRLAEAFKGKKKNQKNQSTKKEIAEQVSDMEKVYAFDLLVAASELGNNAAVVAKRIKIMSEAKKDEEQAKKIVKKKAKKEKGVFFNDKEEGVSRLILPDSLLFDSGKAIIKPSGIPKLDRLAKAIKDVEDLVEIEVVGHTDARLPKAHSLYPNNFSLSAARAGAVAQALTKRVGLKEILRATGMADLKPLFKEKDASGKLINSNMSRNRRVEIILRKKRPEIVF